jgi:hypothetical protein
MNPTQRKVADLIVSHLTSDLLAPEWARQYRADVSEQPLRGHCYVASESFYHLMGASASGLRVFRCRLPDGGTHWWLATGDGAIVDLTAVQFLEAPRYECGVRTHFLSKRPSRRARTVMMRVMASHLKDALATRLIGREPGVKGAG